MLHIVLGLEVMLVLYHEVVHVAVQLLVHEASSDLKLEHLLIFIGVTLATRN